MQLQFLLCSMFLQFKFGHFSREKGIISTYYCIYNWNLNNSVYIYIYDTELQIDSKSASEESQVCIAISGLYISLSGLSWCYLKVTGPLWKKILIEKNLFYDNILKITILLKKFWFSKYYHRINFFLSTFFSTVVRSPLDNIMKDHSSLCRDLKWLYRPGILQMHF